MAAHEVAGGGGVMRIVGWALVAVAAAGSARASLPAVARYEAALAKARAQPRADVEGLYGLALAAGAEVLRDFVKVSEERFAGRDAEPAVTAVPGLVLSYEEVLIAEPQPRFFAALAKEKGRPADQAYFERLVATKPDGTWPVYIQQQTDDTGCVRFEARAFAPVYAGWVDFRKRFPRAYSAGAAQELERAEHALSGRCACGAEEEVAAGLAAIAKALPGTKAGAIARKRLAELQAGKSGFRFECRPG